MNPRRCLSPEIREVRAAKAAYVRAPHGQKEKRWLALRAAKLRALRVGA